MTDTPMRCIPEGHCPQAARCARATHISDGDAIDGSVLLRGGSWCPLFRDSRGWRLVPVALKPSEAQCAPAHLPRTP